jgi:hypothetical protein
MKMFSWVLWASLAANWPEEGIMGTTTAGQKYRSQNGAGIIVWGGVWSLTVLTP